MGPPPDRPTPLFSLTWLQASVSRRIIMRVTTAGTDHSELCLGGRPAGPAIIPYFIA
ncbi:hypothetical protein BH18ACI5_BH18ACI5_18710 [soil metagenome]